MTDNVSAGLKQANLASKNDIADLVTDFLDKLINLNKKTILQTNQNMDWLIIS